MIDDFNLIPLLPEIFLSLVAMGLLIVGAFHGNMSTRVICWNSSAALLIASVILLSISWSYDTVLNGLFVMDEFAGFLKLLIIIGLIASLALSVRYIQQEGMERFEYPVLVLLAGIGMMLMVSANNFLSLYMALELQSLSLYVLAAFQRNAVRSSEAGIKYFILGALSSGMLLFGISLIYGFTGSVDFEVIGQTLSSSDSLAFGIIFGLVFILAGMAFKISAVPFHMWTPDVYQGAPSSVTALFAIVPKIAAMGLLIRLLFEPFMALSEQWVQIIYFIALLSMFVGAFAGIAQEDVKRLLAYSSIGNMGYALIGLVAGTADGAGAVVLYLMIYMIMTAGVFAVVLCMRRQGLSVKKITDLSGLSQHSPGLAYSMAILMFSLSGIPPAAGFFGKLVVFNAAVAQGYYILAVIGILTSVVAAYYYLRIIKVMFFDEPVDKFDGEIPFARQVVLFISVIFVVFFAVKPSIFIDSSLSAATALF